MLMSHRQTFFNVQVKQMRIAAAKKAEREKKEKERDTSKD